MTLTATGTVTAARPAGKMSGTPRDAAWQNPTAAEQPTY